MGRRHRRPVEASRRKGGFCPGRLGHRRRAPPTEIAAAQGGWHIYHTAYYGTDCGDPTNRFIRAGGDQAANGWANAPQVEAEVAAWYDATTLDEEKAAVRRLNKAALDQVVCAPLGIYLRYFAWRKNLTGIVQAPLPLFCGVSKSA